MSATILKQNNMTTNIIYFKDLRQPMVGAIVERGEKHIRVCLVRDYDMYQKTPLLVATKYLLKNIILSIEKV